MVQAMAMNSWRKTKASKGDRLPRRQDRASCRVLGEGDLRAKTEGGGEGATHIAGARVSGAEETCAEAQGMCARLWEEPQAGEAEAETPRGKAEERRDAWLLFGGTGIPGNR